MHKNEVIFRQFLFFLVRNENSWKEVHTCLYFCEKICPKLQSCKFLYQTSNHALPSINFDFRHSKRDCASSSNPLKNLFSSFCFTLTCNNSDVAYKNYVIVFQLVLTVMLLTIIVYIYTVIAFNFFRKFYVQEEDDEVDQKCHNMLTVSSLLSFSFFFLN